MAQKFRLVLAKLKNSIDMKKINETLLPENYDLDFWQQHVMYKNSFVLYNYSEVVGYILVDESGDIVSFAVLEKFQHQGWGKALILQAISNLRQKNIVKSELHVRVNNIQALILYEKIGYKTIHTLDKYYNDGTNAYVMSLQIIKKE
jgi:ribosomal-protein-alanine N-acetyltransferase